ncbi:MAG: imidazoleglycerol-phosphate dehydratase HisB [candidate division KSB1 bacterium]|nr:imidazoleglycerol-phosphate dehydratase HisB [candidate division KSB1 bacterium]
MKRKAHMERNTKETRIQLSLNLDGCGDGSVSTGIGFFDHLLDALQKHAGFDLNLKAAGDLHIDGHHTVEDAGIVFGQVFSEAVGDAGGIHRFGWAYCPLDEALARAVVDISGRAFFRYSSELELRRVGGFDGELFTEFLRAFADNARINLHVTLIDGSNHHHAMEAMIKATARALRMALTRDDRETGIPSTKGY